MPPTITPEGEKAKASIAAARAKRNGIDPTVSANEMVNPPAAIQPPVPQVNTNDGSRTDNLIGSVSNNTQGFIQSQSEEAARAKELAGLLGTQEYDSTGQRQQLNEQFQQPQNLARLTDIQTQLAQRNTQANLNKAQSTEGGAGAIQAQRALSLIDKQAAIRDAGLAAEASVLSGNIETASTLINQAMTDFYQDRTLKNQNMIQQLDYFTGITDAQTAQLLEKEKRTYEEDQRQIVRAETAVDAAVTSGYASGEDLRKLTTLSGDPQAQAAYAQSIVANAARQAASMERQKLAVSQAGLDLDRRQQLYELAALGDPAAVAELGWNPTDQVTEEKVKAIDNKIDEATKAEQKITALLSNKIGLQSSSGEWQFGEATAKGIFGGGNSTVDPITLSSGMEIPIVTPDFGLSGATKARQQKSSFLANADQLLTMEGLLQIGDLAAQDIKLTPITEKELAILFQSASTLNAAARRGDNEKLSGFSIPDYEVEKEFQNMLLSYTNLKSELAAQKNLGNDAYAELQAISQER